MLTSHVIESLSHMDNGLVKIDILYSQAEDFSTRTCQATPCQEKTSQTQAQSESAYPRHFDPPSL